MYTNFLKTVQGNLLIGKEMATLTPLNDTKITKIASSIKPSNILNQKEWSNLVWSYFRTLPTNKTIY